MNICTYVSPVSMKPKIYMIAVYYGTQTYSNLCNGYDCILQLLNPSNIGLVKKLGKESGIRTDKQSYLEDRNLLTTWRKHKVLQGAAAFMKLEMIKRDSIGGDHELFYFKVRNSSTQSHEVLSLQELIRKKIIL